MKRWLLLLLVAALGSGCAMFQESKARGDEERLTKAGFRMVHGSPAGAVAYQVERTTEKNAVVYRYVDPQRGVMFVGGVPEYVRYKDLTVREKAKRSLAMAQLTTANHRLQGPISF